LAANVISQRLNRRGNVANMTQVLRARRQGIPTQKRKSQQQKKNDNLTYIQANDNLTQVYCHAPAGQNSNDNLTI
jgi:hypothetical protein